MSKTGVVGYLGSFPILEVIMGINAFTLSARRIRPDLRVQVVWLNKWFDPGVSADSAKILIDNGADVIAQHTNSPAPCQIAEERGALCFGQDSDTSAYAPTRHMTAIVDNWGPYYIRRVREIMAGNWQSVSTWDGMPEDVVQLAPYNPDMPADVRDAAEATRVAIVKRELHPFAGPIANQKSEQVLAAGETLPDEKIHSMNWLVEGAIGEVPD